MNLYQMLSDKLPEESKHKTDSFGNPVHNAYLTERDIGYNQCLTEVIELLKRVEVDEESVRLKLIEFIGEYQAQRAIRKIEQEKEYVNMSDVVDQFAKAICNSNILKIKDSNA